MFIVFFPTGGQLQLAAHQYESMRFKEKNSVRWWNWDEYNEQTAPAQNNLIFILKISD